MHGALDNVAEGLRLLVGDDDDGNQSGDGYDGEGNGVECHHGVENALHHRPRLGDGGDEFGHFDEGVKASDQSGNDGCDGLDGVFVASQEVGQLADHGHDFVFEDLCKLCHIRREVFGNFNLHFLHGFGKLTLRLCCFH